MKVSDSIFIQIWTGKTTFTFHKISTEIFLQGVLMHIAQYKAIFIGNTGGGGGGGGGRVKAKTTESVILQQILTRKTLTQERKVGKE